MADHSGIMNILALSPVATYDTVVCPIRSLFKVTLCSATLKINWEIWKQELRICEQITRYSQMNPHLVRCQMLQYKNKYNQIMRKDFQNSSHFPCNSSAHSKIKNNVFVKIHKKLSCV